MANYKLGLCAFCPEAMTLVEVLEGVRWEAAEPQSPYGYSLWWLEPEEESRVAHRRCWKALKEWERRMVRSEAGKVPRSMGQMV